MTHVPNCWPEARRLIDRVLDGLHNDADAARLNEILRSDPEVSRYCMSYVELHGHLAWGDGLKTIDADALMAESTPAAGAATMVAERGMMNEEPSEKAPFRAAVPPVHHSSFNIHHFTSSPGLVSAYAVAVLALAVGLLAGWQWDAGGGPQSAESAAAPEYQIAGPTPDQDAAVAQVVAMADCRWADPTTAAQVMEMFGPGRKFALASGLLQITYRVGTIVILQGPAVYEVDSVKTGCLTFGKLTVNVGKGAPASMPAVTPAWRCPFSVRTPTAVVNQQSQTGVFGVEVDRSGTSWTHAFVGETTLRVAGRKAGHIQAVLLHPGQLVRVEDRTTGRLVTLKDRAATPDLFAHLTIMPAGALTNGGQWLKELNADPGIPLIAVGSEPEPGWGRRPAIDWTLGKKAASAGGTGSASGTPAAGGTKARGVIDTCRVTFKLHGVVPATVVLRGRFVAANHVTAMRINGKTLEGPPRIDDRATQQSGTFVIRDGFVEGDNVWEINVDDTLPGRSLAVYSQLSGISPPGRKTSAEATARSEGRKKRSRSGDVECRVSAGSFFGLDGRGSDEK